MDLMPKGKKLKEKLDSLLIQNELLLHRFHMYPSTNRKTLHQIIGNRLQFARLLKRQTLQWIASKTGSKYQQTQKFIKGDNGLDIYQLIVWCVECDIPLKWLFRGLNYKQSKKGVSAYDYKRNR